jgi:hypothetical protein
MISICVGIRNRSHNLIDFVITSMNECDWRDQLELSVFDCHSDDIEDLNKLIIHSWKGKLIYTKSDIKFTRSISFNNAIKQSTNDKIFRCDADMSLPKDFVGQYESNVSEDKVWFPVCFSLKENARRKISSDFGNWRWTGQGMVGIYKNNFIELGCLDEKYAKWGKEDNEFFDRCKKKYTIINKPCDGLFHNWHSDELKTKFDNT